MELRVEKSCKEQKKTRDKGDLYIIFSKKRENAF